MRTLSKEQEQKRRRRETKVNAVKRHKAFVHHYPDAHEEERAKSLTKIVDLLSNTRYPTYQMKLVVT